MGIQSLTKERKTPKSEWIASHLYSEGPTGRQKQKQTLLRAASYASAANATNSSPLSRGLHKTNNIIPHNLCARRIPKRRYRGRSAKEKPVTYNKTLKTVAFLKQRVMLTWAAAAHSVTAILHLTLLLTSRVRLSPPSGVQASNQSTKFIDGNLAIYFYSFDDTENRLHFLLAHIHHNSCVLNYCYC